MGFSFLFPLCFHNFLILLMVDLWLCVKWMYIFIHINCYVIQRLIKFLLSHIIYRVHCTMVIFDLFPNQILRLFPLVLWLTYDGKVQNNIIIDFTLKVPKEFSSKRISNHDFGSKGKNLSREQIKCLSKSTGQLNFPNIDAVEL